jgi:hypothetical protein
MHYSALDENTSILMGKSKSLLIFPTPDLDFSMISITITP